MLDGGEVSAIELTKLFLDRLERHGGRFNAVVGLLPDRALAAAARADRRRRAGERGGVLGIPYGAKDIFGTTGMPTHGGSAASFRSVPDADAHVIRRLDQAGAPILGKLALMELVGFGTRLPTSSAQGPAKSPWALDRWAGGSSGGSAAAVAAGLVPFALGSETAGSVGSPAAWCGITGFRPSLGLIGRGGMLPLSPTLDKPGVLSWSAQDARTVVTALAGRDARDSASRATRFRPEAERDIDRDGLRALRVGFAPPDFAIDAPPAARAALAEAVQAVRDLGVTLVDVAVPAPFAYRSTLDTIMNAEATRSFRELVESDQVDLILDPEARAAVRGPGPSATEYADALRARRSLMRRFSETWTACDLLLAANFVHPWPIPALDAPFGEIPRSGGNTEMVWAGNLAGLPAVFLPAGLSDDGLPVSIQIVGPRWADALVLAVGTAFQASTGWHRRIGPFAPG